MRLEKVLISSGKIDNYKFAQRVYASLCNLVWYDYINDECIDFSWRGAGGFISSIRNIGENYMDFYCSGGEGIVSEEIENLFNENGIVLFEDFYSSYKDILDNDKKIEIFKKNHPVITSYNRNEKIDSII